MSKAKRIAILEGKSTIGRRNVTMDVTEQERQLIEIIREWDKKANCELQIETVDGIWDIALKELGKDRGARGTGASFNTAWDNMIRD